ncbi:MAG TPA: TonB-dependent receptor, partial [Saprospiraceae bacterium]|nr:TonB-dependent receptor [Saprospiraceae bacterium]
MKTKQVLLFLLVLLYAHAILAQTRSLLSGKVTGENGGVSLQGATVHIHDINRDAVTNENGEYKTSFLPAGVYLVEVSHVGYASIVETVVINGETSKDFSLKTAVVEQEGVTVTGVSLATRLRQSPQPVLVMRKTELFKLSSSNFINGLTHLPGVNALTTGPAISKPFIRGLGYNRVLTVNDGIRQEGQQWGDEH